nr:N-acetylneuraminate synthase family protein [Prochlorococcus marinus]
MTYIIAEIGINHNGDLEIAKELISQAKSAGCDAVKFQKRTIEIVYSEDILNQKRESPWGNTQREQKEGLEFSIKEFDIIDQFCKDLQIDWFASSWDIESQKLMQKYNFPHNKIASAMATNHEFLRFVANEKRHTFISTGMMDLNMIDVAVNIFKNYSCAFTLLHTVSTYPALEEDLNLNCIKTLQARYKVPVGYSGHETSVTPSFIAATLGATAIERHITLNRAMYGSDQAASLEYPGLVQLVNMIRKLPKCLGDGEVKFLEKEIPIAKKLRYWNKKN